MKLTEDSTEIVNQVLAIGATKDDENNGDNQDGGSNGNGGNNNGGSSDGTSDSGSNPPKPSTVTPGASVANAVAFAKSPINADFGVNKAAMIADFSRRSRRLRYLGADANKLYDTIKGQGISPEWFFAYELQEDLNPRWGWLNHTYPHGDAYSDAVYICNWIKQWANSNGFRAATEGGLGNQSMAAQWNVEFPKGTIGRLYLQATAAASAEMLGQNGGYYGKPLAGCAAQIRAWGGHS